MTIKVVDRVIEEIRANRSIWNSFKMADQENLRSEIFEIIFDKQLPGVGVGDAERLADQILQQAKANDDILRSV
jgi:type I restriction enzyme R subunit